MEIDKIIFSVVDSNWKKSSQTQSVIERLEWCSNQKEIPPCRDRKKKELERTSNRKAAGKRENVIMVEVVSEMQKLKRSLGFY